MTAGKNCVFRRLPAVQALQRTASLPHSLHGCRAHVWVHSRAAVVAGPRPIWMDWAHWTVWCVCCRLPQGQGGVAELPYSISAVGHSLGGASLLIHAVTAARAGRSTGISRLILLTPAGFHHNCPIVSLAAPCRLPEGDSVESGTLRTVFAL